MRGDETKEFKSPRGGVCWKGCGALDRWSSVPAPRRFPTSILFWLSHALGGLKPDLCLSHSHDWGRQGYLASLWCRPPDECLGASPSSPRRFIFLSGVLVLLGNGCQSPQIPHAVFFFGGGRRGGTCRRGRMRLAKMGRPNLGRRDGEPSRGRRAWIRRVGRTRGGRYAGVWGNQIFHADLFSSFFQKSGKAGLSIRGRRANGLHYLLMQLAVGEPERGRYSVRNGGDTQWATCLGSASWEKLAKKTNRLGVSFLELAQDSYGRSNHRWWTMLVWVPTPQSLVVSSSFWLTRGKNFIVKGLRTPCRFVSDTKSPLSALSPSWLQISRLLTTAIWSEFTSRPSEILEVAAAMSYRHLLIVLAPPQRCRYIYIGCIYGDSPFGWQYTHAHPS